MWRHWYAMQQQEARLRRNDDPDLVIDFQPAATLEGLLIQKDLDMPAQLGLILRCQPTVIGDVPFQNLQPCPRKRTGTNFSAPLFLNPNNSISPLYPFFLLH